MTTSTESKSVDGEYLLLDGEQYYRIRHAQLMPEFVMSLVGFSDHWMFVTSSGALTAGRRNPDQALFPYLPDDQIFAQRASTGPSTLIRCLNPTVGSAEIWEPFVESGSNPSNIERNLYKSPLGNKLVFEEHHELLQLSFRYRWTFSERFGFVRSCRLVNTGSETSSLELLDGLKNVLPSGVGNEFLTRFSNLANAYKRSELVTASHAGLFYLSSIPTDRAEPSEGLNSTVVWQTGIQPDAVLLSLAQIPAFRQAVALETETDVRGKSGAYFVSKSLELEPGAAIEWHLVADLMQDHSAIVGLDDWLNHTSMPESAIAEDIEHGEQELGRIVSSSDGMQCGSNQHRINRHLANTVFNVMRGGVPIANDNIDIQDFSRSVENFNRETYGRHRAYLASLPGVMRASELSALISTKEDRDLTRLCMEYLPLAFSRRHGDPTRPWNRFSIDLRTEDGRTNLNYQGNWRDIFQNWEALGFSYPGFLNAMISRFVNATTADGYNPYRLTKDGFEWEEPVPNDPWANIGYWGDHQIIYLLKLLELSVRFHPDKLKRMMDTDAFVHANVPYRIKGFEEIKSNVYDTIEFNEKEAGEIQSRVEHLGADGKLLFNRQDEIHYVTLVEKLLTLSLAKLSNFVPDGGIWMNTQRPEWNDANNALVGNGISLVTACYLHRWCKFLHEWMSNDTSDNYSISSQVHTFLTDVLSILRENSEALNAQIDSRNRNEIVESLSTAGSKFRAGLYSQRFDEQMKQVSRDECLELFDLSRRALEVTIRNNQRDDGLFHSYNLLDWRDGSLEVEHLYEMLEGQVAVLSSGILKPSEVDRLLNALRESALYRENQNSYLLYPDRQLPKFLAKNHISAKACQSNPLLEKLLADGDERIAKRDVRGDVHFNARFRNSAELQDALNDLNAAYEPLVREHGDCLVQTFDDIFGHRRFTGRSGTFFGYEGLGSIYWHMVSKLGLAVSENLYSAIDTGEDLEVVDSLKRHLEEIRCGIGAEKSPATYGAFPTDPYSHTPEDAGVKQPGMTGQVKEDILARFAELGVQVDNGCLEFRLPIFDQRERLSNASKLSYVDLAGEWQSLEIPAHGFGYTLFQVPIIYQAAKSDEIHVHFSDGTSRTQQGKRLDRPTSQLLFSRGGHIVRLECHFKDLDLALDSSDEQQ